MVLTVSRAGRSDGTVKNKAAAVQRSSTEHLAFRGVIEGRSRREALWIGNAVASGRSEIKATVQS